MVAIFGPKSKYSSEHIRSITDSMEIPFIETRWNYRSQKVIGEANKLSIQLFQVNFRNLKKESETKKRAKDSFSSIW